MIKTEAEYSEAVSFIDRDLELYDFDLSEKMTSLEYNLYLQDTEYYLDFLYEKIRSLEDIINYIQDYSDIKLTKIKKEIQAKEIILEDTVDKFIDAASYTYSLTWDSAPNVEVTDRDGNKISTAEINNNGYIIASGEKKNYAPVNNISKISNYNTFSDNLTTFKETNNYLTSYNLDTPDTIIEELSFDIIEPESVNYSDFEPINCTVEYLGMDDDNKFVFMLACKNVTKEYENFDFKNYTGSNLNTVSDLNMTYNTAQTVNINQNHLADIKDENNKNDYILKSLNHQSVLQSQIAKSNSISKSQKGV